MNKILLSWLCKEDFVNGKVNFNGPTVSFYKYFYDYDFHIVLVTTDMVEPALMFKKEIEQNFKNIFVIVKPQNISFEELSYQTIKTKAEQVLLELKNYNIDILLTGNPRMKAVWFILHYTLGLKTSILEISGYDRPGNSKIPELYRLDFEVSSVPVSAFIHQELISRQVSYNRILTDSYKQVYSQAFKFSQAENSPVLITGGRGSGKEELARYIHENSPSRSKKPFHVLDCAAYSSQEVSYRLFGFKKGAFPGATYDSKGLLVEANGGTLLLKNIDSLALNVQNQVKRFMDDSIVAPLVGREKKVDVRLIFSSRRKTPDMIANDLLSLDLFYHLVLRLKVPELVSLPMEEKKEIINRLLELNYRKFKRKSKLKLCSKLWDFLYSYEFPGNFHELIVLLQSLYIVAEGDNVCVEQLPDYLQSQEAPSSLLLSDVEKVHIEKVLRMFKGNKSRTARALGIALNTLKKKIRDYNIDMEKILQE